MSLLWLMLLLLSSFVTKGYNTVVPTSLKKALRTQLSPSCFESSHSADLRTPTNRGFSSRGLRKREAANILSWETSVNESAQSGTNRFLKNWLTQRKTKVFAPHPLRMQKWKIYMKRVWKRKFEEFEIEFTRDGKVIASNGETGHWRFDKFGLLWDLPMSKAEYTALHQNATVMLHFSAEIHWNVFGAEPKMFRGVVCRDRFNTSFLAPHLFRPVIATFSAIGIGEDTVDVSYSHRN